jgi:hypothetical protein
VAQRFNVARKFFEKDAEREWLATSTKATPERRALSLFALLITVLVLDLRPPEQRTFKALLSLCPPG